MILECIHTEPWDAVFKAWWERFPDAPKKPVASALWPVPVPMIPWMLIIHAADEAPLEGETSVEPHKTPYTLEQLLTTVKALHRQVALWHQMEDGVSCSIPCTVGTRIEPESA